MRSDELKINALSERRKACFIFLKCTDNCTRVDKELFSTCCYRQKFSVQYVKMTS